MYVRRTGAVAPLHEGRRRWRLVQAMPGTQHALLTGYFFRALSTLQARRRRRQGSPAAWTRSLRASFSIALDRSELCLVLIPGRLESQPFTSPGPGTASHSPCVDFSGGREALASACCRGCSLPCLVSTAVWPGAWPCAHKHLPALSSASQPVTRHLPHLQASGEEQPGLQLAPGSRAQLGFVLLQGAKCRTPLPP